MEEFTCDCKAVSDALNISCEIFTAHSEAEFNEVISSGLRPVAEAAKLQRVAVYRVLDNESGDIGQIYVWENGDTVPLDKELVILPKVPPVLRWLDHLTKGEIVHGNAKEMPQDQADFCALFKVRSIVFVPVFTHGKFWGIVTLEDQINYRHFSHECLELLCSIARLCANAFIRNEMTQSAENAIEALKHREKLTRALNKAALSFLSQTGVSFEESMTAGVREIVDIVNVDRMSVFRNITKDDGLYVTQLYRWHKSEGGTTNVLPVFKEASYKDLAPRWEKILGDNGIINGPIKDLPEYDFLKTFDIVSVLVTPVFMSNEFWGFVIYEDHRQERFFDDETVEMLRSASLLCVSTVLRAEMEREIEDANEFNRTIIKDLPIGFTVFDDTLTITDCNDKILKSFGTTKDYYLSHFNDFSPEYQSNGIRSPDSIKEVHRRALDGEKFSFSWEHKTFAGEITPFEVTLTRVNYKDRFIVLAYQYDLSNIKKLEKNLAEAEELTTAITETSPIPYVLFNEELIPVDCNNAAIQLFGSPDKQYVLDHFWDTFNPEKQPDGEPSYKKALKINNTVNKSELYNFEWTHLSLNGELIPVENTIKYITHKGKSLCVTYKYDLRNTRKMLNNIKEQSELLKTKLEQQELISDISRSFISSGDSETYVKEAITKLGRYHKVSRVFIFKIDYENKNTIPAYSWSDNNSTEELAKIDSFTFVRNNFPEILPDCSTLPVMSCSDISVANNKTLMPLLDVGVHAFIAAPLYVESRLWGILTVEQCRSARYWTDNEKSFVAMTAGTIGGVIMRNLYNTMLNDALQKATIASKAKGQFLSNMSHEMRTPLNAIIGMTAIAKNAADLDRKNYALNKIEDASTHLLGVINDVLDMSKIEANKLELVSVEYNFEKLLQKTVAVITFRVEEKHQRLTVHIDNTIPEYLIGDDQRLIQVITNLLSNAVKFTPEEGSITLDAILVDEEDDIYTIKISVTDTGIGISDEQKARLFQSFQQAEASTVRKFGGTGLGLAICKNIVEMMGGTIWVESELNKGSSFSFTIKAKRGKGTPVTLRERSANWDQIRVLAVDDDPDILEFFKNISQKYNVKCDTAISGEDALRLVEKNGSYNVYFIDWKMPGIDGITLSGALRSMEKKSEHSVVIMISAAEWTGIEQEAKKAGVDRFLPKPLFPSAVADTICECLGIERYVTAETDTENELFKGYRILMVEDVEINREIVLTILEPSGLEIECAENGVQALEMFRNGPDKYDLIFMDVQMPEMDGYDSTRYIRAYEKDLEKKTGRKRRRVPIIAMTANVFKEDIQKCKEAGMDDHLGKPLDFDIVMEKLRLFLK